MKQIKIFFLGWILIFSFHCVSASDIIYAGALNSNVIMIHFDDGFVRYHKKGEARQNEWVTSLPLDINKAQLISNYEIKGGTGFYSTPKNPVKIERKSKGTEFTWLCENWSGTTGCVNGNDDHAKEHWIYLTLPEPLKMGETYEINTTNLAYNGNSWKIHFTLTGNRSEAIHVNIIGYNPDAPHKYGYLYHWGGSAGGIDFSSFANKPFYLIHNQTGDSVYSGVVRFRKSKTNKETLQTDTPNGNYLGADVYECNFSAFKNTGEYVLAIDGVGCSFPFKIQHDIYRLPFYTSVRGLFHNRSGIALEKPFTQSERPAPHNPLKTPGFEGKLKYTTSRFVDWNDENHSSADKQAIENGILGPINTWGWYQDAGDWDGYFSHMKIPVMLMLTWEMAPEKFSDGGLNLPEGINQIPDIIDEAGWLIRFFQRTRKEILERGYGTGGVGSRIAPDWFGHAGDGKPSYEDNGQWIVSGEDPFTTYFYAGLAAHFQLILNKLGANDPDSINWNTEAIEAFSWAESNTMPDDLTPFKVHNYKLNEYKLYAATTLFRLTGNEKYLQIIQDNTSLILSNTVLAEDQKWGPYSLMTMTEQEFADADLLAKLKGAVLATADQKYESVSMRACRYGGNKYLPMLVGQPTTPRVFEMMLGHYVSKEFAPSKTINYLSGIYTTADYFLGCNPHNMTWITHVGVRYPQRVLHIDSWYSESGEMAPGIIPYGPWRDDNSAGPIGPWSLKWPYKTLYPENINNWPGHERWYNNYTTPSNAEFTIHQNTVLSAIVYGYLCDEPDGSFNPNDKPTVEIKNVLKSASEKGDVSIEVTVNDPDGLDDIAWVEFYNDWHIIGQINRAPYNFTWERPKYGPAKLLAKVVDKRGFAALSDTFKTEIIPKNYNVTIVAVDSLTQDPVANCEIEIQGNRIIANSVGEAYFEQVNGLLNVTLENESYYTKSIQNISIYSDTTLTFKLAQKKNEIVLVIHDQKTGETFEGVNVVFNDQSEVTNLKGEVFFQFYKGIYSYLVNKNSFHEATGTIQIQSDTVFHIYLQRAEAEIKFVIKEGNTPVNNAVVILNNDTLISNALGIARFKNLMVSGNYAFKIFKGGFNDFLGNVNLETDTVINISLNAYPVSAEKQQKNNLVKIWPNPARSFIYISASTQISEIEFINITGKILVTKIHSKNFEHKMDVTPFTPGIYFVKIRFANDTFLMKKILIN